MGEVKSRLTVFFEDPFWIGIFERAENGKLSAAKVTFGAEPKDAEVLEFVLRNYNRLDFSPAVDGGFKEVKRNPKKLQRDVKKLLQNNGAGTKSQQALKLQYEQNKQERKVFSKKRKQEKAERLFQMKQQKKKDRHRGH